LKKAKSPKGGGAKLQGLRRYQRYVSQLPDAGLKRPVRHWRTGLFILEND